jgi:hypothetical protein
MIGNTSLDHVAFEVPDIDGVMRASDARRLAEPPTRRFDIVTHLAEALPS